MTKAGEKFGLLLDDELCCGSTAKRIGQAKLFERLRSQNEKVLRGTSVKRIVTACAGCYKTLKQDYPGLDSDVPILHSTVYLADLLKRGKLPLKRVSLKVTYHDPCHLGRHAGVYDPPREVLRAIPGLELVEMKSSKDLSRCCGGGAGVKTAYPTVSQKAALKRIKDAEKTGAEVLVTTCPFCVQTLKGAAESSGSKLEIVELAVLLDRCS
jgi:Fe-S oxidoreductase